MLAPIDTIFCDIDDFCKDYLKKQSPYLLLPNPEGIRNKESQMSISEIITIIVLFQMSHYRTFKDFYIECALKYLNNYFLKALSYT